MTTKRTPPLFYVILILIPVLFFTLIEVGLRVGGYGRNYELFKEVPGAPPGMIYVNPEISYKYFGNLENPVFSQAIGMDKDKPLNGFRVFVFGGSSAQGFPFAQRASFPSHLERKLQYAFPNKIIEVVNLGTSAINSHTLLDILPDVLDCSPDLILVYAGHNEYYGALGPASTRLVNPKFVRLLLDLREFRLVQLLENVISTSIEPSQNSKNLMQDMIGQSNVELSGHIYAQGIRQFNSNLTDFIKKVQKAEVPLVIGTVTSNIKDHKPFNSNKKDEQGNTSLTYFNLGRQFLAAGDYQQAKVYFILAKEMDGLRFRAPEDINKIIKQKAGYFSVPLVDIDSIFHANSQGQITGDSLMCDHLHPSREGYFLMANAFFNKLASTKLLPGSPLPEWPSDSLMLARFPYSWLDSTFDRRMLLSGLGQYPFVPQGSPNPYEDEITSDKLDIRIRSKSQVDSIRPHIATKRLQDGDTTAFKNEMDVILSSIPLNESTYLQGINNLSKEDLLETAYPLIYPKLRQLSPGRSKHKMLGLFYMHAKEYDSAIYHLEAAVSIAESSDYLQLNLGKAYGMKQNWKEAVTQFSSVIARAPENKEAYHLRGGANFELKEYSKAVEDMTEVIRMSNMRDALAFIIRGYAKTALSDISGACDDWHEASRLGEPQAASLVKQYCK